MRLGHRAANGDDGRDATRRKDFVASLCLSLSLSFLNFLYQPGGFARRATCSNRTVEIECSVWVCEMRCLCSSARSGCLVPCDRQGVRPLELELVVVKVLAGAVRRNCGCRTTTSRASEVRSLKGDGFNRRPLYLVPSIAVGVSGQWAHHSRASGHCKRWTERGAAPCMHCAGICRGEPGSSWFELPSFVPIGYFPLCFSLPTF